MLYQTFLNTLCACGIIIVLLATLAVLKWSVGYLFARNGGKAVKVEPTGVIDLGATATPEAVVWEPEPKAYAWHLVAAVKPEPEPVAEEPVECGNCGKEIKSSRTKESNPSLSVYECEHCGTKVGIRV